MTEQVQHLLAHFFQLEIQVHQHLGGHTLLLTQQAEQEVFGPNVVVIQVASFLDGILDHLLGSRSLGQFAHRNHFRAGLNDLLDLVANLPQVDVQISQDVRGDAAPFLDQAEQDMLGSDVLMVEPLRLLIGELHHLASTIGEAFIHQGLLRSDDNPHFAPSHVLLHLPFYATVSRSVSGVASDSGKSKSLWKVRPLVATIKSSPWAVDRGPSEPLEQRVLAGGVEPS